MSDEQRLNSLDRFRKQPGRLVLEEHGHCEVPAGCGGVVLRWRNPHALLPVTINLYAPVPAKCLLDGSAPPTGRVDLAPGGHVVAITLENVDLSGPLLMFAATHDPQEYQRALPAELVEQPLKVVTDEDGTWKFSLDPPAESWADASFDDSGWPALVRVPALRLTHEQFGYFQSYRCTERGAACLGLPVTHGGVEQPAWWKRLLGIRAAKAGPAVMGSIWVRKTFDISLPQPRGE